jgi:hypothetical protein
MPRVHPPLKNAKARFLAVDQQHANAAAMDPRPFARIVDAAPYAEARHCLLQLLDVLGRDRRDEDNLAAPRVTSM